MLGNVEEKDIALMFAADDAVYDALMKMCLNIRYLSIVTLLAGLISDYF
jgi:hypothetical protein